MIDKNQKDTDKKCNEIIKRLGKAGVLVRRGKKTPKNGQYSGIVGHRGKLLELNIPD